MTAQYQKKLGELAKEVISVLVALSKQGVPLTAETLAKSMEERPGVDRVLYQVSKLRPMNGWEAFEGSAKELEPWVERLRQALERVVNHLQLPENSVFSMRVHKLGRKLAQSMTLHELDRVENQVQELLRDFRDEISKEQQKLTELLYEVALDLVETEREYISNLVRENEHLEGGKFFAEEVDRNVTDIEASIWQEDGFGKLRELVRDRIRSVRQAIMDRRMKEEELAREFQEKMSVLRGQMEVSNKELIDIQRKAEEDPLTGLLNRRALNRRLKTLLDEVERTGPNGACIMMDIDWFKKVNDRYGHLNGDKVLTAIGACLKSNLKPKDAACRYGGEEFSILLPEANLEEAFRIADHLREKVKKLEFVYKGEKIPVTISGGITDFRKGDTAEEVLQRADKALYEAKREGRDQIRVG